MNAKQYERCTTLVMKPDMYRQLNEISIQRQVSIAQVLRDILQNELNDIGDEQTPKIDPDTGQNIREESYDSKF